MKLKYLLFVFLFLNLTLAAKPEVTHRVWFDISIPNVGIKRLNLDLYGKVCPKTVENFVTLSSSGKYDGLIFHRVIPNFMIQGLTDEHSQRAPDSIYGPRFDDENFTLKHFPGCLSMANAGPNTNGGQFFVTVGETSWLNGRHTVFGGVASKDDLAVARMISEVKTNRMDRPLNAVTVVKAGGEALSKSDL